jgi:hypothetical protein
MVFAHEHVSDAPDDERDTQDMSLEKKPHTLGREPVRVCDGYGK